MSVRPDFAVPPELAASGLLPSPPGVVMEVTRLIAQEDSTADDLAAVIETDPVLSARLLGTVNSGLYTLVREIHSITDAAVLLGFRAVRSLALGVSVSGGLPDGRACQGFDLGLYWRHSLMNAVLARDLASHIKRSLADEAFTIGLIGNLGRLVIAQAVPAKYSLVLERDPWPDAEMEIDVLGYSSASVAAAVLHRWGLPDSLCHAVCHVADPQGAPEDLDADVRQSTLIVGAASLAVDQMLAIDGDTPLDAIADGIADRLGIDSVTAHETLDEAADHIGEMLHLIANNLPDGIHPNDLLAQAQQLLHGAAA